MHLIYHNTLKHILFRESCLVVSLLLPLFFFACSRSASPAEYDHINATPDHVSPNTSTTAPTKSTVASPDSRPDSIVTTASPPISRDRHSATKPGYSGTGGAPSLNQSTTTDVPNASAGSTSTGQTEIASPDKPDGGTLASNEPMGSEVNAPESVTIPIFDDPMPFAEQAALHPTQDQDSATQVPNIEAAPTHSPERLSPKGIILPDESVSRLPSDSPAPINLNQVFTADDVLRSLHGRWHAAPIETPSFLPGGWNHSIWEFLDDGILRISMIFHDGGMTNTFDFKLSDLRTISIENRARSRLNENLGDTQNTVPATVMLPATFPLSIRADSSVSISSYILRRDQ